MPQERKIIDESNYSCPAPMPMPMGPAAIGRGGDPLFRNIRATKAQLEELLEETTTVQDWIQRETSNNVALACLNNENLKEIYFEIKDGFADFGPMILMGFKTPQGIEIPRLKLLDNDGNVIQVLTGPLAMEELNKRALAYKENSGKYEELGFESEEADAIVSECLPIEDYS